MKKVKIIIKNLLSAIYPNKCIACGEIITEENFICDICNNTIERVNLDNICVACGFEKEHCVCKYNIFRFNGVLSPFKNEGIARQVYYSYKFSRKQQYAKFFAYEICNAITYCYEKESFDIVCAVSSYKKSDYDHSGYIAQSVAKKLQKPFHKNLIRCIKKTKKQHKSTIKERLQNVEGKYIADYRIDGKKVLLIDDIKTTGATLDECAKVLLFAGAESVLCATVLGAKNIDKTKIEN